MCLAGGFRVTALFVTRVLFYGIKHDIVTKSKRAKSQDIFIPYVVYVQGCSVNSLHYYGVDLIPYYSVPMLA